MLPKMYYKNAIFLIIGLIIGIRLTDIWNGLAMQAHTSQSLAEHDDNLAEYLYNETRILCWVMTTPENHLKRAIHIRNTWGARCNKVLFMSTQNDEYLETIALPIAEGRSQLWHKTREAFKYIYDHHFNDADWFLKADDDSYFILENLRYFLHPFAATEPVYFGCKFHPFVEQGYMSGGAGYVLSREALSRFARLAYPNSTLCSQNTLSEDKEMGICLQNIGVVAGDSRDEEQRERFMPLAPQHLIPLDISEWYAEYLFYKPEKLKRCCSRKAISFHYIKPKELYMLDYLLYQLNVFGVQPDGFEKTGVKANMTELMRIWRNEKSNNL